MVCLYSKIHQDFFFMYVKCSGNYDDVHGFISCIYPECVLYSLIAVMMKDL